MSKNYYEILGVDKSASKEDIKKAYKNLARKYHPDVSKEPNAEEKFKEINEAAGVLLDDEKKKKYDTYGSADGPQGFGGFGGGGAGFDPSDFGINLDDIFESFGFGSGFSGGSRSRGRSRKETTTYAQTELTLEEVYFGAKKEIKISREEKCDVCNGKGAKNSSDIITCSNCGGNGVVIEVQRSFLGNIRTQRTCPTCGGTGKTIKNPCNNCGGKGHKKKTETIDIKIPKGIESGTTLRISKKGDYDAQTDSYGDLYLKVYVKEDKNYQVEGSDLHKTLNINFISAILGDDNEFEHFDKTLSVKIPEGTQSGTVLRLKGKGLPIFNYDSHGDLYIKINVEIPTKTTKEQKKILHDYAKTLKDKTILDRLKGVFK